MIAHQKWAIQERKPHNTPQSWQQPYNQYIAMLLALVKKSPKNHYLDLKSHYLDLKNYQKAIENYYLVTV